MLYTYNKMVNKYWQNISHYALHAHFLPFEFSHSCQQLEQRWWGAYGERSAGGVTRVAHIVRAH